MLELLQSKLHRATVTDANINYEGSISISENLLAISNMKQFQKVLVVDINNGNRFETYIIVSNKKNDICVNGAAARLVNVGDKIIIMSFKYIEKISDDYKPQIIKLNDNNEVI